MTVLKAVADRKHGDNESAREHGCGEYECRKGGYCGNTDDSFNLKESNMKAKQDILNNFRGRVALDTNLIKSAYSDSAVSVFNKDTRESLGIYKDYEIVNKSEDRAIAASIIQSILKRSK